jgi:hypothetical protein
VLKYSVRRTLTLIRGWCKNSHSARNLNLLTRDSDTDPRLVQELALGP